MYYGGGSGHAVGPPRETAAEMESPDANMKKGGAVGFPSDAEELPTTTIWPAELPGSHAVSELEARDMAEKERIARVDNRVDAGYDGAYRGN